MARCLTPDTLVDRREVIDRLVAEAPASRHRTTQAADARRVRSMLHLRLRPLGPGIARGTASAARGFPAFFATRRPRLAAIPTQMFRRLAHITLSSFVRARNRGRSS